MRKSTSVGIYLINITREWGYMLTKLVWYDPCNRLAFNFSLIVYPLDREKAFTKTFWLYHVMLKLGTKTLAIANDLSINAMKRRQIGKEKHHRQRVIKLPQCCLKTGIPIAAVSTCPNRGSGWRYLSLTRWSREYAGLFSCKSFAFV